LTLWPMFGVGLPWLVGFNTIHWFDAVCETLGLFYGEQRMERRCRQSQGSRWHLHNSKFSHATDFMMINHVLCPLAPKRIYWYQRLELSTAILTQLLVLFSGSPIAFTMVDGQKIFVKLLITFIKSIRRLHYSLLGQA
jgi:hypothetical protein